MEHCCYQRKYVFGIKKCGKQNCNICRPPRLAEEVFKELHHLPDPVPENSLHYKSFSDLYGTLTTEQHRPTLKNKNASSSSHGIPFSPNAQTARELILCSECLKPRVIYSQRKLSIFDESVLSRTIEGLFYSCGSVLQGLEVEVRSGEDPSVLTLFDRVFVRENLTCDKPIEGAECRPKGRVVSMKRPPSQVIPIIHLSSGCTGIFRNALLTSTLASSEPLPNNRMPSAASSTPICDRF